MMCGCSYLSLMKKHTGTLEVLSREAMRVIIDLLVFTKTGTPTQEAQIDSLVDQAKDLK